MSRCLEQLELSVSERLSPLVPHEHADLLNVTIRLLLNLSFDAKHRAQMVNVGLLPKLVNLIRELRGGDRPGGTQIHTERVDWLQEG